MEKKARRIEQIEPRKRKLGAQKIQLVNHERKLIKPVCSIQFVSLEIVPSRQ